MEIEREQSPRRLSVSQKRLILQEHLELGLSVSSLARKYGVNPVTIYSWKRSHVMEEKNRKTGPNPQALREELERVQRENAHLKKALAEVSVDKSILQDALELYKKKSREEKSKLRKCSK
jgi:transposase-like protein